MKKYQIIYADPPWNGLGWNNGSGWKCPANHYQVQDAEWIKRLPVSGLADEPCFLFLWVTFPNLQTGLDVIRAWGFKYATCGFNWVKRNRISESYFIGCGNYTRANSELCLLGTKGHCQKAVVSHSVPQICDARILRHSEKPVEIRDRIVQLCGDLPCLELFARQKTPGWDVWANEVESDIELTLPVGRPMPLFRAGESFTGETARAQTTGPNENPSVNAESGKGL